MSENTTPSTGFDPLSDVLNSAETAFVDPLWETLKEFEAAPNDNEPTLIESIGQVRLMTLPPNWNMKKREDKDGTQTFYEVWASPEDESTTFEFYYRATPIKDSIAKAFSLILRSDPHPLNTREIQSLGIMISYAFDKELFNLIDISTENLNGRRVLMIEGEFMQDGITRLHIFVDADNTGRAIQELIFQAPTSDYSNSVKVGERAFDSIIWVWE